MRAITCCMSTGLFTSNGITPASSSGSSTGGLPTRAGAGAAQWRAATMSRAMAIACASSSPTYSARPLVRACMSAPPSSSSVAVSPGGANSRGGAGGGGGARGGTWKKYKEKAGERGCVGPAGGGGAVQDGEDGQAGGGQARQVVEQAAAADEALDPVGAQIGAGGLHQVNEGQPVFQRDLPRAQQLLAAGVHVSAGSDGRIGGGHHAACAAHETDAGDLPTAGHRCLRRFSFGAVAGHVAELQEGGARIEQPRHALPRQQCAALVEGCLGLGRGVPGSLLQLPQALDQGQHALALLGVGGLCGVDSGFDGGGGGVWWGVVGRRASRAIAPWPCGLAGKGLISSPVSAGPSAMAALGTQAMAGAAACTSAAGLPRKPCIRRYMRTVCRACTTPSWANAARQMTRLPASAAVCDCVTSEPQSLSPALGKISGLPARRRRVAASMNSWPSCRPSA